MFLLLMQVQNDMGRTRGVSVWVNEAADTAVAEQRAIAALADSGWRHIKTVEMTATGADDYFQACPSQQAFIRAQTQGVAWRFDDE